jgi:WD40 repeat protein
MFFPSDSAFRPNGKQISIGGKEGVKFFDINSGSLHTELADPKLKNVTAIAWAKNKNRYMAVGSSTGTGIGTVKVYDIRNSKESVRSFQPRKRKKENGHQTPRTIIWGPCDNSIAVYFDSTKQHSIYFFENNYSKSHFHGEKSAYNMIVLEETKGKNYDETLGRFFFKYPLKFLNQNTIVTAGNENIYLFNTSYNNCIQKLSAHFESVYGIEYSTSNQSIYSYGKDAKLVNWSKKDINNLYNETVELGEIVDNWSDSD